jgi:hypothetical protein
MPTKAELEAMPKTDPKWEGLLGREATKAAEQEAAEKAAREERFQGRTAQEISAMIRADVELDARTKDTAANKSNWRNLCPIGGHFLHHRFSGEAAGNLLGVRKVPVPSAQLEFTNTI